ncbi:hypothetical protein ZIOFF_036581 [Zingiber officinale]|uniref:AB hydrolase-1 domain-containing protein n=1 Tax=Zingiber officinale TaxID=94328 RepID=A0A8J5L873_ZINOF|nr:hypothetical protein ZIOFF_036581 [Zingiber officinale]
MSRPEHFVLVHGVGHGAWCWFKVRCHLESAGHKVSCLDLLGHSDPNSILCIQHYDAPLLDFMSHLNEDEKVVLVGHSAGGLSLTHAMHAFKSKIKLAIFVAATMLPWGYHTEEDIKDGVPNLSRFGDVYELTFNSGPDNPPTSDSTLACMLLRPWPACIARAQYDREGDVEDIRRVYIKTSYDNMVSPEQQDGMIRRWPPDDVLVIDSDHSPFFSAAAQLSQLIIKASLATEN